MIDDKKIEFAKEEIYEDRFLLNGEEIVFNNDEKEEMFYKEDIKEAIGLGAKWGINELLKAASEVPRNDNGKVLAFSKEFGDRNLYDMNDELDKTTCNTYQEMWEELKVGERITLEAVEQYDCRGCFFEDNLVCIKFACCEGVRSDGKSVSGYLGGIEIPNEYQTIKGEFVRPLTQKEIDKQPKRWGNWYQVGDLVSLEEIENLIKNSKRSSLLRSGKLR